MSISYSIRLILALLLPITLLAANTIKRHYDQLNGTEVSLPIAGFDPRDLLSGHYLSYRIDYGVAENTLCPENDTDYPASICLQPEQRFYAQAMPPVSCRLFIQGKCQINAFKADIERFYIPEEYATTLERAVMNQRGTLLLSIATNGKASIKTLLIDGKPWQQHLNTNMGAD